jgi:hypothetical protein
MSKKKIFLIILAVFLIIFVFLFYKYAVIIYKVNGIKLEYADLSQKHTKIVSLKDITGIKTVACGWIVNMTTGQTFETKNQTCYRVSIGKYLVGDLWYIYFDKKTIEQLKVEQLFKT